MKSLLTLRPFQVVLIAIFVLFAFGGLYLFAIYKGFGNSADKIGTVVIWGTLPQAAVTAEINALTNSNKEYGKVSYVQEQSADFDSDLGNAIASGNGPDLIIISQEQLLSEEGKIVPIPFSSIPERTFVNTYLPEDSLYLTSSGSYAIPYLLDPLVLYYNQNLLASNGIATPPTTWEAVTGLAPALSKVNTGESILQSAIAFGTYTNIEDARAILSLLFLQAGNTITSNSSLGIRSTLAVGATTLDGTPPAISALNFYTQFADPSRTVYSWNSAISSAQQAFLTGKLAFYVGYASEEPFIKAANPNLNFDMAPIPQPQTATNSVDYGLAYAFAIPKASQNPKGAYAVATALTSGNYLPIAANAASMAPANRYLLTPPASDLYAPVYYPEALVAQGWLSPAPSVTDGIFSSMISSITSGQLQAPDALTKADEALDAALTSP